MLKTASDQERAYYEGRLYPLQDGLLEQVPTDRLYLTGGTCLSRFYYHHRYSDDLDFFYDGHRFPQDEFVGVVREYLSALARDWKMEMLNAGDQFIRAIVHDGDLTLKLEFVYEGFPTIGERIRSGRFLIDTREKIELLDHAARRR